MASYTPTTTCNDLAARIADEMARSDLTSQIQKEINSAILHYSSKQLWGTEGSWSINTVAGQRLYAVDVTFRSIASCIASYNNSNYQYPILPRTFEYIQSIDFGLANFNSYPQYFAYQGNQFRFYPPTLGSGTITVFGQVNLLPLVFSQTTPWPSLTVVSSSTPTIILDPNNNVWQCTTGGTTAATAPTWTNPPTLSSTVTESTNVVWTCTGTAQNFWTTEAEPLIRNRSLAQIEARYINDMEQAKKYEEMESLSYLRLKSDNIVRGVSANRVQPTTW